MKTEAHCPTEKLEAVSGDAKTSQEHRHHYGI
jgi:hypothetical protein